MPKLRDTDEDDVTQPRLETWDKDTKRTCYWCGHRLHLHNETWMCYYCDRMDLLVDIP